MQNLMSDPEAMADLMNLQQTFQRLSTRAPHLFSGAAGLGGMGSAAPTTGSDSTTNTNTTSSTPADLFRLYMPPQNQTVKKSSFYSTVKGK